MGDYKNDLESYIKQWAWQYRIQRSYRFQYDFEDLEFDVDTKNVHFTVDKLDFSNYKRTPLSIANVVFTSNYTNNTDETQEVSIKAKRTTSATARARIKHGFIADYGVGLKFRMPSEVVGAFDGDVAINGDEEEKVEQKMSWNFSSKISAPPRRTTVAKFEVNEERFSCDFSTYVHVKGVASVKVVVRNTGQTLVTVKENIKTILSEYLPEADEYYPRKNLVYVETEGIKWPFRGNLDFHYGISQNEVIE